MRVAGHSISECTALEMSDLIPVIGAVEHPASAPIVQRLLARFRLVEAGNSVVVIERNLDVIKRADWVIDLGPGAGHHGGRILFTGPPAELVEDPHSITAKHLRSNHRERRRDQ